MKKIWTLSLLAGISALGAFPVSAADILARVLSSTPVVQRVAVPRQVCNNQPMFYPSPTTGAGAVMGALAGGAVGNAIGSGGSGDGRALATVIGLVGGAVIGDRIENTGAQAQYVQQCRTQTGYEHQTSHYDVVYEYQGARYQTQMSSDPGAYVRLQVSPVGAVPDGSYANTYPASQTYVTYGQPLQYQPIRRVYAQPQVIHTQPAYGNFHPQHHRDHRDSVFRTVQPAPVTLSVNIGGYPERHHRWR